MGTMLIKLHKLEYHLYNTMVIYNVMYSITFYNYVVNSIQLQLELHLEVGKKTISIISHRIPLPSLPPAPPRCAVGVLESFGFSRASAAAAEPRPGQTCCLLIKSP